MSNVPKGDRGESKAQFLDTATEIWEYIYALASKIPKKYFHYPGDTLRKLADEISIFVTKGNSRYPTTKSEAQKRREYFLQSREACYSLSHYLDLVREPCNISFDKIEEGQKLLHLEIKLLTGELESATKRYKDLP